MLQPYAYISFSLVADPQLNSSATGNSPLTVTSLLIFSFKSLLHTEHRTSADFLTKECHLPSSCTRIKSLATEVPDLQHTLKGHRDIDQDWGNLCSAKIDRIGLQDRFLPPASPRRKFYEPNFLHPYLEEHWNHWLRHRFLTPSRNLLPSVWLDRLLQDHTHANRFLYFFSVVPKGLVSNSQCSHCAFYFSQEITDLNLKYKTIKVSDIIFH